jgi:hypothetical protein
VVAAVLPVPRGLVERAYSQPVYPVLQHALTSASNVAPFALLDALLLAAPVAFVWMCWRDALTRGATASLAICARRLVVFAASGYLVFLATWGLNYRRVPLADALRYDARRISSETAAAAASLAVNRANALHDEAHASGWPAPGDVDASLVAGLHRAVADMQRGASIVPARPKRTIIDWYFRRAGVAGMTDPFLLETLIAGDVLPFERPFVVAHEWSHLAGFADEGDANLVGWLACMRASPAAQYSGWLFLYSELAQSLGGRAAAPIAARLGPGPRADLRAIRERTIQHVSPRVATVGWRAYDAYLKANRVDAGATSYAQVVRLVLGVRLPSGEPLLPPDR